MNLVIHLVTISIATDILKNLLDDPFCNGFKHVVALSNFNLTCDDTRTSQAFNRF
jgi:hypothetical protein